MSLINRMLQDLSLRQPAAAGINDPLQFSIVSRDPEASSRRELGLLLTLIAVFSSILWWLFAQQERPMGPPSATQTVTARPSWSYFSLDSRLDMGRLVRAVKVALPLPATRPDAAALRLADALRDTPRPRQPVVAAAAPDVAETASFEAPVLHEPAPASRRGRQAAQARLDAALRALRQGEPVTAEVNLRESLELDPELHGARDLFASLLLDQERLAEAESLLHEPAARPGERAAWRRLAARLELGRGQPQAALTRLEAALPALAADPEYHGLLASVYQRLDRHEAAATAYRSLLQLQPDEAHWWAGYGISRDAQQQPQEALRAYDRARALGALDARVMEYVTQRSAALRAQG